MKTYKKEIKDILNSSNRTIERGIANAKKQLKNMSKKITQILALQNMKNVI